MIVIIGAGPAGLAAAKVAAQKNVPVTILDGAPRPGGQYWRHRDEVQGYKSHRASEYFDSVIGSKSVTYIYGAQVWSAVRNEGSITLNYLHEGSEKSITAEKLILTTGAYDRSIPFDGWELPGSMTPGAAQALLKGHGELRARRFWYREQGHSFYLWLSDWPNQVQMSVELLKLIRHFAGYFHRLR